MVDWEGIVIKNVMDDHYPLHLHNKHLSDCKIIFILLVTEQNVDASPEKS